MASSNSLAVLMPVFNDQSGLETSLQCLEQEPETFDVVVVDDGSEPPITVDTDAWKHTVKLLTLERNMGIEHALNRGLDYILENGYTYTARLDAGDISKPGRINGQLSVLEKSPEVGIVGTWVEFINEDNGEYFYTFKAPEQDRQIRRKMKENTAFVHSSVMFRTELINKLGKYSSDYKAAEDYELWARMLEVTAGYNLQQPLVQKEVNMGGISATKRKVQVGNRIRINLKYFDYLSLTSYLGVMKNCLMWLLPLTWTTRIKKVVKS